ncbi:MAG: hypothetical protein LQ351_004673 [Letrouitia transgressa]|nr:MAG: hypothetical protein LQ351_004673 [Letrouitia transgressa]
MPGLRVTEPNASEGLEPVAIIGMGCRWPGDSESPSELWDFLQARKDAYSKFPKERINADAFYHPNGDRPGSFKTEGGCFLKSDVKQFDANFFGIHPKEVLTLDPAQRKFFEVVYEAIESAGIPLHKMNGSNTGTFVGNFNYDHQLMQYRDAENALPYSVTGSGITILSNRVNYLFNLKGPSMTLDTACSSSMYALHLACSAIQTGDCTSAIVGGSNLILTPECQIFSSVLGAVSPTSVCHTFDARADGYARADGIGALFIKKLSQAVEDGDPIRAIIRGTAFNANGRTGGITHPSPDGQEACMRRAYERAGGLDPTLTGYFECHGTGTAVGDPIEVSAIGRLFSDSKTSSQPLLIGSIKSNMGHSEPSSGIAGVMKAVIAIEHGIIPPTIGLQTLNPNIDLKDGRLKIVTESTPWPDLPVRRASINSFGYGGSNAHAIVESVETLLPGYMAEHQSSARSAGLRIFAEANGINGNSKGVNGHTNGINGHSNGANGHTSGLNGHFNGNGYTNGVNGHANGNGHRYAPNKSRYLLPFSAHDDRTLQANFAAISSNISDWNIEDIAFTLGARRSLLTYRSFITATEDEVREGLQIEKLSAVKTQRTSATSLGFVFTGQGAQWPQMGLALMKEYPSYSATIRRLDSYLNNLSDGRKWTIEGVLKQNPEESLVSRAELSQPLVTAVQIALVNLLSRWNVRPRAVVGHSSGEIAASYAAGLLSEEAAMIAAYLRGKAVSYNEKHGLMMAVGGSVEDIEPIINDFDGRIVIACHNSPESLTLSGDAEAMSQLKEICDKKKIFCRALQTYNNAYHSHHMQILGPQYEHELENLMPKNSVVTTLKKRAQSSTAQAVFFSSVFGHAAPWSLLGPKYWRQNLESPVLFHQAVSELLTQAPVDILVEIGPHSALMGPLRQLQKTLNTDIKFPDYFSMITRNGDNVKDVLALAGNLFNKGYDIDVARVNGAESRDGTQYQFGKVITDLPRYQWQYPKETPLYENRYTREWRLRMHPRHDILGSRMAGANRKEPTWRNKLNVNHVPWLADHKLGKEMVFPSTGYLALALEAATQVIETEDHHLSEIESYEVRDVSLSKALIIPEDDIGIETLFTLRPAALNAVSRHQWVFEFLLTSVSTTEEGHDTFTEHCRGFIEVELERHDYPESQLVRDVQAAAPVKKIINAAQWYENFAQVGLCYGPMFQGLSKIFAAGDSHLTEAQVGLEPTAKVMKDESRYIIHPATLDASMQLSILAAHKSTATKFKRAFMPTAFESIRVWPKVANASREFATSFAGATLKGVRGLSSDIVVLGSENQRMLEAKNIFLIASDQSAPKLIDNPAPYTRMVWKPAFDALTTATMEQMYPPKVLSDDAVIPSLNHLALHQLIQFRATHPNVFTKGSEQPHLQRLLDWTNKKLDLAKGDPNSAASTIMAYSKDFRAEEIARLSTILNPQSSESRLMCHLYNNLPAIYAGEKTGIQVALQDNLLLDNYETGQVYREGNRRLASAIALYAHQNPGLKILEVGAGTGSATSEILPALKGDTLWRQYVEYRFTDTTTSFLAGAEERFSQFEGMSFGAFDMEKSPESQGYTQEWDLVVASNVIHATSDIKKTLLNIHKVLKPGGKMILLELTQSQLSAGLVLGTFSDFWKADNDPQYPRYDGPFLSKSLWRTVLPAAGYSGLDFYLDDYSGDNVSATVVCASAMEVKVAKTSVTDNHGITVVYRQSAPSFMDAMAEYINKKSGLKVHKIPLSHIDMAHYHRYIFLLEAEKPFFIDATSEEWTSLQRSLKQAASSLWLTKGDLMGTGEPLHAMISGLAKGMKTENSSLRFSILDLDKAPKPSDGKLWALVEQLESRVSALNNLNDDSEFRYKDGVLYISRLTSDDALNEQSKAKADMQTATTEVPLAELKQNPLQMAIDKPGVLSSIYFKDDHVFFGPLADDEVEIEVKYAGVNNKDIAVLTGRHHSDSFSDECAGYITKTGRKVTDFCVGDAVYCQSFSKFGNYVRDKAAFCQRLQKNDTLEGTGTLPIAFMTAIYGLVDLGRLAKGESVLIQSATGAVGLAACQIADWVGAEIFATVGTQEKKEELLNMGYGIKEDHIFWSRDKFTARDMLQQTAGKGIDVILCSARGELMHEYWRCIAFCGRFVEIGRTEVLDNGSISLDMFRRNATFTSFDLEVLSKTKPQINAKLMKDIQKLKSQGHIKPLPLTKFHVSEIDKALMTFAKGTHIGKIVISYDDAIEKGLQVRRSPFTATFDPNAAYLLVGCLGGLGRSFSQWAVAQGARNLIYLARSGAAKPEAQIFLDELRAKGVTVSVVKGDVNSLRDVQNAVNNSAKPIRGVVQGALTLKDGLFESMSLERFNATVRPRVIGTLNLHEALKNSPLDFFEIWSSWTVVFGTATQSNYLASNSFLDAFARHRLSLGLPCTSLALSQVLGIGIVSYMPEYQQAMIRNGFYGNDEDEFLQFCEAGVSKASEEDEPSFRYDRSTRGHLLVGIEPAGLQAVDKKYPLADMAWYHDPRFKNLIQATRLLAQGAESKRADGGDEGTVLDRIRTKISRLLYVPLDEVDTEKPINDYGIDSMIAAELRNWFFTSFGKEVSLLNLLSATMTIQRLAEEAEVKTEAAS